MGNSSIGIEIGESTGPAGQAIPKSVTVHKEGQSNQITETVYQFSGERHVNLRHDESGISRTYVAGSTSDARQGASRKLDDALRQAGVQGY